MVWLLILIFFPLFTLAQPAVPDGRPVSVDEILSIGESIGGFLMVAGGIVAGIVFISSGFMYLAAGSNSQKVTAAKNFFLAGIIGSLIIFGSGVIINTVRGLASNPLQFFQ